VSGRSYRPGRTGGLSKLCVDDRVYGKVPASAPGLDGVGREPDYGHPDPRGTRPRVEFS